MPRVSKKNNEFLSAPVMPSNEQELQVYKTALYARLSVEDNGKDSDSLEAQLQYLHAYIEGKPQFEFCGEFIDNGFTGTNYKRPGFQNLIDLVQKGQIECIIVKDLSRLGRNYIETGSFIEKICPMLNLRLIAINDGYDTAFKNASSDMSMSVMNIANDMYAKDISRKVCSALQGKIERGEYIGNYAPYGYLKDPADKNHLLPDPALISVVNRIFRMRADGMGIGSIAKVLNEEDIPSPGRYRYEQGIITNNNKKGSGLLWNRHVLTDLLKNVVYVGDLAQARCRSALHQGIPFHLTGEDEWVVVHNTHEGIVPRELFLRVQEINQSKSKAQKENTGKYSYLPKAVNIYGKKLVCADCGSVIKLCRSISNKKDKAYFTFKCPTHIEHRERGCSDKSISQAEMDAAVLATIQAHIRLFVKYKEVIDKLQVMDHRKGQHYQYQKEIRDIEKRIRQRNSLCTELYTDVRDGLITEDDYVFSKAAYTKEIQELQKRLDELQAQMKQESISMNRFSHWSQLIEKYNNVQELTKEIVEAFVQEIRLYDGKKIVITLNYMNEFNESKKLYQKRRKEVA
jgi:DNA invertase Pin-like site-specific DNA recombinase